MRRPSATLLGNFAVMAVLLANSILWTVAVKSQVSFVPRDHRQAEPVYPNRISLASA